MPEQVHTKSGRRRLRVSVRGLAILILVVGGLLGWVARGAGIQRDAIAAIQNAGGTVKYDWRSTNGRWVIDSRPWILRWLVRSVGIDYFVRVVSVSLPHATNASLVHVGQLVSLKALSLRDSETTDEGLRQLDGLTNLESLDLTAALIGDDALANLKRMTELRVVSLGHTRIGDVRLIHLKSLANLRLLVLVNCETTLEGTQAFQRAFPQVLIYQ